MTEPVILEFPFDSGAYEAADQRWTPQGVLAVAENVRLDLDGRLGVRPGYTALGATTYSANSATFFDLVNYDGRLVALGDQTGLARATDLFEYTPTGAALWRATSGADVATSSGPRLPRATDARSIGRIPDLEADAKYSCVAASSGGKIVSVVQLNATARIHLFDPSTDQTLVLLTVASVSARACAAGSNVWVVVQASPSNAILGYRINPATEEAFTAVALVSAGTVALPVVDIAIAQTGASDFTVLYSTGTNIIANRFNSSGTVQSTWTHTTDAVDAIAVCGNAGGTRITAMWHDSAAKTYKLQTRTQTGGAIVGPTALFGAVTDTTIPRVGMCQEGAQICVVGTQTLTTSGALTENINSDVITNEDTHALTGVQVYADAVCSAAPVGLVSGGRTDFFYGAVDRLADIAGLGTMQLVQQTPRIPQAFVAQGLAGAQVATNNALGSCCKVGTKLYWGTTVKSIAPRNPDEETFGVSGVVIETELSGTSRRQITQLANALSIAGAMPLTYEGRYLVEQGFAERPVCSVTSSAGGGKSGAVYFVATCWEVVDARGNILRSAPSEFQRIDLSTTANSTLVVATTTPHSLRRHPLLQTDGGISVRVGFYSTVGGGANLFLESFTTVPLTGNFGDPISASLGAGDNQLVDNPVLYTQSQTPLAHCAPQPYRYIWPARARAVTGGLLAEEEVTWSKLLFPSEPVEFAAPGRLGFTARANQAVTAVGAFEASTVVWSASEIQQIFGRGPEHSGTGEFDDPLPVSAPGGCSNAFSLVSTPLGFFFQMAPDKLMLLARAQGGGAGAVSWAGQPVRQTLALFPNITGAVHVRSQMLVAFSCNNVAGTDSRLLIFDLRREQWFIDTIGAPIAAVTEYQGRLALLSAGVVFLQDVAAGSGAMPTQRYGSGMVRVTKALGWGHIYGVGIIGTVVSACKLEAFIDYDDGAGSQSLGSLTFAGTEGSVEEFWSLNQQKTSRFSITFVVSSASSNLVGFRANGWAAKVEAARGTVRRGSTGQVS